MSTEQQRAEWRELAEAATPGEWNVSTWYDSADYVISAAGVGKGSVTVAYLDNDIDGNKGTDAAFIAAARTAVPALLADVDALTAERDALAAELATVRQERESFATELMELRVQVADQAVRLLMYKSITNYQYEPEAFLPAQQPQP